ncbi:tanabin-like [Heptranchias perlo]|uniref:tanabin-like n=1 Tax=Heptranchias perlo TaxID=212740 RepID=UPI003559378B
MDSTVRQRPLEDESFEFRDLNGRLESYLQRVSFLEQENALLRGEIETLKRSPASGGERTELEEGLELLRGSLGERWRERDRVALECENLQEEVRLAKGRCRDEVSLQERAKRQLAEGQKVLEEEKRGRAGLGRKVLMLEGELKLLEALHQEERGSLQEERARSLTSPALCPLVAAPSLCPQDLGHYSQKLSELWAGSLEIYGKELANMERSLAEARERQEKAREERRRNQLKLQALQQELEALRERKGLLEGQLSQQSQNQQEGLQEFQATIELLEQDKQSLTAKMDQILDEQRELMQMKLALSLEVATYRALLDAEVRRLHSSAVTPRLPASHRDARQEMDRNKLAFKDRRATLMEQTAYTSKNRDEGGNISRLRAQLHSGTDSPAYGLRDWSLPRDNRPKELQPLAKITTSSENEVTTDNAKNEVGTPALGYEENLSLHTILESATVPRGDSQRVDAEGQVGEEGFEAENHQFNGETKGRVTEAKYETSKGEKEQEKRQLNGDVKEDVVDREELNGNIDPVLGKVLFNGTSKEHVEEDEMVEDKKGLVQEEEEINEELQENLMDEKHQEDASESNPMSEEQLFHCEIKECSLEDVFEIMERKKGPTLEKQQRNGGVKGRAIEKEQSGGKDDPGAEKVRFNGTGSENVTEEDKAEIIQDGENEQGQSNGETQENMRDGQSEEEKDLVSQKALSNGTTEELMRDELKPRVTRQKEDLGSEKGQLNGGPEEHVAGDKESEMSEGTIDSVPERELSRNWTQEPVAEKENQQTEVEKLGKELSSDTDEEHSTEEMSQISEREEELEPEKSLGRGTAETHVAGEDKSEITEGEGNLTSENGEIKEQARDEKSETSEVNFDSMSEKGLFSDTNGEHVLEWLEQERLGKPTKKKASENGLSTNDHVTEEVGDEITEVQKDQTAEQEEYNIGIKEWMIEEEKEMSEGKNDPEFEKLSSGDDIQEHIIDKETQISEGMAPEKGQFGGDIEEQMTDKEASEGKVKAASEKVLLINTTEEQADEDKTLVILGKEDLGSEEKELNEEIKESEISEELANQVMEKGLPSDTNQEQVTEDTIIQKTEKIDLGSEEGERNEEIKESEISEELEISEVAEQEVPQIAEEKSETFEGMEGPGSGKGMIGDTIQEHVTEQMPQTEEVKSKITEEKVLEIEKTQSNGETKEHWIEKQQSEIAEELADQVVEEQMIEDLKLQKTEKIDLGSEKGQLNEEAEEHAVKEDDSEIPEGMKDLSEKELARDTAKECATEEVAPTSEGRDELVSVKGEFKGDLEHVTEELSVEKIDPEGALFSDVTHEQQKPWIEEGVFGTSAGEGNREPELGQSVGETKEHVTEKEQSEVAEGITNQVPEAERSSDTNQEQVMEDMTQIPEGKEGLVSEEGQLVEETQEHATEDGKCQTSELEVESDSYTVLLSGTSKEDVVEDNLKATEGKQDLVTEKVMFNDTTKELMSEEVRNLELTEDKQDLELGKGQLNEEVEEHVTENEIAEGNVDPLFSDTAVRRESEEDKSQVTEGRKDLGSEKGQDSEETEEHIEDDKEPEIAEQKATATGNNEDYPEVKKASPVDEMKLVEDEVPFYTEEALASSQANTSGHMEKGVDELDEPSESEERQEIEEESAASPSITENEERQTPGEESLTPSAAQSLNGDCLAEDLQTQSLLESAELTKAPGGVDGIAEEGEEFSRQNTRELLLEAQEVESQSLGECPEDVSQSHQPLSEARATSEDEDTVPLEDAFSESSMNTEYIAVENQQTWTMRERTDSLPVPGVIGGDINVGKSDLTTMLSLGDELVEADHMEESDFTSNSNGEGSSTRSAVVQSEDGGSINPRETKAETLIEMEDKSQTPVKADVSEAVNIETWPTPSDMDSSAASGGEDSVSQTLESPAKTLAEHGENLEPRLSEKQLQESRNGEEMADREDPLTAEEVIEGREFLNSLKEEIATSAISKLGGDPDQSPAETKFCQTIKMDDLFENESLMDEPVTMAFQEETTTEVVQSTSPEKVEDSQHHEPREEAEENSLNMSQLGSFNSNSPKLNSDKALATTASTDRNDDEIEHGVLGERGKLFGDEGLHESSVSQDLHEEFSDESGQTELIGDTYDTAAFIGTQHSAEDIDDEELTKKDSSLLVSREIQEEAHSDSVDLMLVAPSQRAAPEEGDSPRSVTSLTSKARQQELSQLQAEYFGGSGKGEETAVGKLAAAYHYWSSEDE